MKSRGKIIGYYNETGYEVWEGSERIYEAGNNPYESSSYVPVDEGLPLETIKAYCEATCKELAEERDLEFAGVQYDEELNKVMEG